MSFSSSEFIPPPQDLPQDQWAGIEHFFESVSPSLLPRNPGKVPPFDLSMMNNVLDTSPVAPPYSHAGQYDHLLFDLPANGTPSQNTSYNFQNRQYTADGYGGSAGQMLQFQGNMMMPGQRSFQGHQNAPSLFRRKPQTPKRRDRSSTKTPRNGRAQKRKRTAKDVSCDYPNGTTCGEACEFVLGSDTTCCSSCSDSTPCGDPHCALPCVENSCDIPICPEDCTVSANSQQVQFQQGYVPSSERLSFLQENGEPWNPIGCRKFPESTEAYSQHVLDSGLAGPGGQSLRDAQVESSTPPTPPMAQNMATPYPSEDTLQTPQFAGLLSHIDYPSEPNAVTGAGGMFNSAMLDWAENFQSTGHDTMLSNCGWLGCEELIPAEEFLHHLHQAHVDPQISYPCIMPSSGCPSTLETDALDHLQNQHGFDMNGNFLCPAPTCSPQETYNDPVMFHNHLDQAHSFPVEGALQCRLYSCNSSFSNPNQLLCHISASHPMPPPPLKVVDAVVRKEAAKYPISIPNNEELVEHTCKWKLDEGGICGNVCGTEKELQEHVKIKHLTTLSKHTGYICKWENCNRPAKMGDKQGFSQRGKLERHMASHTNYKCCCCDICGLYFSAEQALKQHKLLHSGDRPWQCKYCEKSFPQQSACTIHERTHTKEKPLVCDVCGKRFSESSNFAKHRRTHGEMGKHKCEFPGCGKNFHRSDQLKKHMKAHEPKVEKFDPSVPSSEAETDEVTHSVDGR